MSNPFADPRGRFVVLLNENGRYSLWPSFVEVPDGWTTVLGSPGGRTRWTTSKPVV